MATTKKITANGTEISVLLQGNENDYICLTDMARYKDKQRTDYIIQNWLRSRNTIEYLGVWEQLHNPNFNPIEFDGFRNQAGLHSFSLTAKEWVQKTNAIGIYSKAGRYGGTYAHKDIAFNFGMWLSPTFQLYVVKEYQQLKEEQSNPLLQHWDVKILETLLCDRTTGENIIWATDDYNSRGNGYSFHDSITPEKICGDLNYG